MDKKDTLPLNDIIDFTIENAYLQVNKIEVNAPYIVGKPGGGKTASIYDMCVKNNWSLISTHIAMKPLEELGGIPQFEKVVINNEEILATKWSLPDIMKLFYQVSHDIKEKHKKLKEEGKISVENPILIWLVDDFHLCQEEHINLFYEPLTERTLRGYKFPDNLAIVIAGNHGSDKANAQIINSAIMNRIILLPTKTEYVNWKKNFAIIRKVHPAVISFLGNDVYQKYFHEDELVDDAWASPRTWTRLANEITARERWNPNSKFFTNKALFTGVARGYVGKEAASNFVNYFDIFSKFDIKEILSNSDSFELPSNEIDQYALLSALTVYYIENFNKNIVQDTAKIVYKYLTDKKSLAFIITTDLAVQEHQMKKLHHKTKGYYSELAKELMNIDRDIAINFLKEFRNI